MNFRKLPSRRLVPAALVMSIFAATMALVSWMPQPAFAGTGTVTTDDQQWVSQALPTSFNCSLWSSVFGGTTAQKRTVVSFNTAGLVPAGEQVTAATLRIYPKANYSGNNVSVKSYTRTSNLCDRTWNNLGTVGSQVGISSGNFTKNTYKSISIAPSAINTSGRTGFVLDASAASLMEFRSDVGGTNLNPSKLDLTWAPAATTTTTTTTTTTPPPPACSGVTVTPTSNVQQLLDSNPDGTTFCFQAGTYDHSTTAPWAPKANQKLIGALGAGGERLSIVTGAKTLTSWTPSGATWFASGQTQQAVDSSGECRTGYAMCNSSNELFRDGARVKRVATLAEVGPSTWYFDTTADRIYVGQDPAGHSLKTSVADKAILNEAGVAGVVIKNFVVEMFATTWGAAVQVHDNNTGWLVENVESRLNHLSGIEVVEQGTIRNSVANHNGKLGTGAGKWPGGTVTNNLIEQTEMAYNNEAGFEPFWEAGGGKYGYNDGLTLRGNHVHHNYGYGLWIDLDVIHADLDANTSEFNDLAGIHYEISWQGRIHNNILRSNGQTESSGSYAGTGIYVFNSKDVEVDHNTVQDNVTGGIVARQYDRGSGLYGVYEVANLNVHDNTVKVTAQSLGTTGALDGVAAGSPYYTSKNNHWQANTYQVPAAQGTGAAWFYWEAANRSFSAWQGYGHDTTGSITTY